MGYLKNKYTKEYFLGIQDDNKSKFGVEGINEFKTGGIRSIDKHILDRVNFKNQNVLDLGFGRGEAIKYAIEHKAKKVIGVDFSKDANHIAKKFLLKYGLNAELHCQDVLTFLNNYIKSQDFTAFSVILMLDFIEHVPRAELRDILLILRKIISEKSVVVVNTPIFNVDNDVITEGLKDKARDTSDEVDETQGMHCNRYTKKTLKKFMNECGYTVLSGHFFVPQINLNRLFEGNRFGWNIAYDNGFPIYKKWIKERYEYGMTTREYRNSINRLVKVYHLSINLSKLFIPEIIKIIIRKFFLNTKQEKNVIMPKPRWYFITDGNLKGRPYYGDPISNEWQNSIVEGTYDNFIFRRINRLNLEGKTIYDIGAHVGFHSMNFAQIVGQNGKVYAFEPNLSNIKRMKLILSKNKDLAERIKIYDFAIANRKIITTFYYSSIIDNGYSSGSYIDKAHIPRPITEYSQIGFKKKKVNTLPLDNILQDLGGTPPILIKIDVEGAENQVLDGAKQLIKKYHPIFLIEVHTIYCSYYVTNFLKSLNYSLEVLKEESDGRCFIYATYVHIK